MKVFGLTGGIASGKSTVASMLVERGVAVVDADRVAREVVEPGEPALEAIVERFGDAVLDDEGRLDRPALGAIVFADHEARADLDEITHPAIAARSARQIGAHLVAGAPFVVYDAALIVENELHRGLEGVIVVDVPPDVQLARLLARDGLDETAARARIDAQIDPEARRAVATWLIDNTGTVEQTEAQVDTILSEIRERIRGSQ